MDTELKQYEFPQTMTDEERRLGSDPPFVTILKLCIAPLLFSIANGFQDTLDLFFVKKGYGTDGVTIVSIVSNVKSMCLAFSAFASQATVIKMGEMITKKNITEAGRLYSNMVRMALLVGVCISILFTFVVPGILKSLGMPDQLMPEANKYLLPVIWSFTLFILFQISVSTLMAEGKVVLTSIIQIAGLVTTIILDVLFIFGFKAPVWSLIFPFILPICITAIILNIRFFMGKETIQPRCSYIIEQNSRQFWKLMKLAIPGTLQIIINVCSPIITMSIISQAAAKINQATQVATVLNTTSKPYGMIILAIIGSVTGLTPSATYAFHKEDISRVKKLALSTLFLPALIIVALWPLMVFKPHMIMDIWISDPEMSEWIPKLTPKMFYTLPLSPISTILGSLIVVFGRSGLATLQCILKMVTTVSFAVILYNKFGTSPEKILFCNPTADIEDFICVLVCFLVALRNAKPILDSLKPIDDPLLNEDGPQEKIN